MTLLLILIIATLGGFSIFLVFKIKTIRKMHFNIVNELQMVLLQLLDEQNKQAFNLKLSEDLKLKLFEARITIDKNIMELQHDLFEENSTK